MRGQNGEGGGLVRQLLRSLFDEDGIALIRGNNPRATNVIQRVRVHGYKSPLFENCGGGESMPLSAVVFSLGGAGSYIHCLVLLDDTKAAALFRRAADQGHLDAHFHYGLCSRDADQGHAEAYKDLPIQSPAAALKLGQMTPPEPTLEAASMMNEELREIRAAMQEMRAERAAMQVMRDERNAMQEMLIEQRDDEFQLRPRPQPQAGGPREELERRRAEALRAREELLLREHERENARENASEQERKYQEHMQRAAFAFRGQQQQPPPPPRWAPAVTVGNFGKQTIHECFVEWSYTYHPVGQTSNIIAMLQNSDPGAYHAIYAAAVVALFSNTYMKSAAISAAVIAGLEGGALKFKSMISAYRIASEKFFTGRLHRRIATLAQTWRKRNLDGMTAVDFNALVLKYQKDLASVIEKFVAPSRRAQESAFSAAAYRTGQIQNQNPLSSGQNQRGQNQNHYSSGQIQNQNLYSSSQQNQNPYHKQLPTYKHGQNQKTQCLACESVGHTEETCFAQTKLATWQCSICKGVGHISKLCPTLRKEDGT
ncbi:hypothetical protein T492DRAFT_856339 [Pavlovales sp. CCMP2436]|nr:hypothetical protein T492DRAFT_856339 [Pavlovales sp. CCMP2436]